MSTEDHKIIQVENLKTKVVSPLVDEYILKGVDFELLPNEVLGIIGETGSGKTMSVMSILGLVPVSIQVIPGKIELFQTQLSDLSNDRGFLQNEVLAKRIAIIFQNAQNALNPLIKIQQQMGAILKKHLHLNKKEINQRIDQLLIEVGLHDTGRFRNSYPHELSGGELQRVMIAIGLSCKPEVLILDEPTSALDLLTQKQIIELLEKIKADKSISMIFITHDLPLISNLADRILHIENGKILACQDTFSFFTQPQHAQSRRLLDEIIKHQVVVERTRTLENALIKVDNLSVTYQKRKNKVKALESLNFEVYEGEVVGIIGASGSGKTTLGKVIGGILEPTTGRINFTRKGTKVHYIYQDSFTALDPDMTVFEILKEVFVVRKTNWNNKEEYIQLLDKVNLGSEVLDRKPSELSGGQRQRINLARALATHADVLICDEITSGLDLMTQFKIIEMLKANQKGRTILFISHDLNLVKSLCDRVIIMQEGNIDSVGKLKEIFEHPTSEYTTRLINSIPIVKYFLKK